ncbi:phosphoglycerate mutase (2,3-diphosphoglycerate-independent) [Candidatus Woesebacteria bacterium RBG_16_34_12]|uniref:2,3-bisphosphoglycerate-independent phosphoglycerate mutase n=1 Tax=Candidatus Woesebacteria bacterium RBG_16_34_12 TaxID=1802480 RepID=A0A1F7XBL6_9BACT|nr:MAG: phosphoglycerate mutase (2,3-diphosphoglycerate-independent) [Candidatus Woesebacteria bacterium RBG_16_34_12]
MNSSNKADFVILAILDGWGLAPDNRGNAITQADTPNINRFWLSCPHSQLTASGQAVGLPRGEEGSTETGHLNLGAGRIIYQELERINLSIADGTFFDNKILLASFNHIKKYNSNLHLMGLIGAGWVHSNIEHLFALIRLAKIQNINKVYLHLFTDGRDSPPTSALTYINMINDVIKREKLGKIASIMGRYWAMDRDKRWERTEKAYLALTKGEGAYVDSAESAIKSSYQLGKTDEFIEPALILDKKNKKVITVKDNDSIIFFNFRIDRPRQLSKAFLLENFTQEDVSWEYDPHSIKYEKTHLSTNGNNRNIFNRGKPLKNLYFVMMTEYSKQLVNAGAKVAFPPEVVTTPLGQVISLSGFRQLRIAESEKERFVTFYFNGLREEAFEKEERIIIPSPNVETYDLKPEMSALEITEQMIKKMKDKQYKLFVINYANPDMLGHTGNIGAAIKACEIVDKCIGKLANIVLATNGVLIITSDHGNAEDMIDLENNQIETEHSTNPVPFIAVAKKFIGKTVTLQSGILADVAPTILGLLNLPVPGDFTGRDLLATV